jgi:hypothetical protein
MYTYAFLPTPSDPLELPCGIVGSLELVETNQLSALVEPDLAFETLRVNDRQLLQAALDHDRIIRELFEQTVVLPLQFGNFIAREDLIHHLQSRRDEYLEKLNRLHDRAEYTLKLVPLPLPEPEISSEVSGKAYFLAKKQHYQTQADQRQQQQQELEQLIAAIAQTYPNWVRGDAQDGIERLYILGDRQADSTLQQHIQTWQTQAAYWELSLGEALPPYHFVS